MKKSAFQEALTAVQKAKKNIQAQASGVQQKVINYNVADFQKDLQKFLNNFTNDPVPKNRKAVEAIPIASLDDGGILYSDGTAKMPGYTPTSPSEQNQLNILRKNLLQQMPYTPKAARALNDAKLFASGQNGDMSAIDNDSGGYANPFNIHINRNNLSYGGKKPTWGNYGSTVLAHELLHFMDDQVSFKSKPQNYGSSLGFSNQLKKNAPKIYNKFMKNEMSNKDLYDANSLLTRDVESFAYHGENGPSRIAPSMEQRYSQIYQPMSKNLTASPKYPTNETLLKLRSMLPQNKVYTNQGPWKD